MTVADLKKYLADFKDEQEVEVRSVTNHVIVVKPDEVVEVPAEAVLAEPVVDVVAEPVA